MRYLWGQGRARRVGIEGVSVGWGVCVDVDALVALVRVDDKSVLFVGPGLT
jgi:hypothetical protein